MQVVHIVSIQVKSLTFEDVIRRMDPYVVKISPEHLDELRVLLMDHENTHQRRLSNQYEAFRFYYAGGLIVGYSSGKVVANSPETAKLLRDSVQQIMSGGSTAITIGSDEAGKGEWLGPLVVAAVGIDAEQEAYLRSVGVMDSKQLSPYKIGELAFEIEEHSLASQSITIPPKTFERRLAEMRAEGKNLNHLLAWAHAEAIGNVFEDLRVKAQPIRIVIDEFDRKKMNERLERRIDVTQAEVVQMHNAEKECAVAAASIIARDTREAWLDKASLKLGVELIGMSINEALTRSDLDEFAKVSYLREANKS